MKERLRRFMSAEVMNSTQLANELNIQASGISHILSGRNKPSYDFVTKLLTKFPNLNPDWLILGKGPMHRDEIRPSKKDITTASIPGTPQHSSSPTLPTDELPSLFDDSSNNEESENFAEVENSHIEEISNKNTNKKIERIVILYSDGSFGDYTPALNVEHN